MRIKKLFFISLLALIFLSPPVGHVVFGSETKPASSPEINFFPNWLLENSIRVHSRLTLSFDGSDAAQDIQASSETTDRLLWVDAGNWRLLRQLPFVFESQEFVSKEGTLFLVSEQSRKILPRQEIEPHFWMEILRFPYELSQQWNYIAGSASWEDWFQKLLQQSESFENAVGDQIEVKILSEEGSSGVELQMKGVIKYQGTLDVQLELEWRIEHNLSVDPKSLEESLVWGGGSS